MNNTMSNIDWLIIAAYLLGVVGLGIAAGFLHRRVEEAADRDGVVTFFPGLDHLVEHAARRKTVHGDDGVVM